jgi:peptidylprolyl isomerase
MELGWREGPMAAARSGDTVKVHYTVTFDQGRMIEASFRKRPLEFTIGACQLASQLEEAVVGMSPGESKTITIPRDDAYGPYRDDLVLVVGWDRFPEHVRPQVGQDLQIREVDGDSLSVKVIGVSKSSVTLDANHPLAGKDLTVDIRLVEIV